MKENRERILELLISEGVRSEYYEQIISSKNYEELDKILNVLYKYEVNVSDIGRLLLYGNASIIERNIILLCISGIDPSISDDALIGNAVEYINNNRSNKRRHKKN